jgi:hypothetical protein
MVTISTFTPPAITPSMLYAPEGRRSLCPDDGLLGQLVFGVNPVFRGWQGVNL